MHGIFAIVIGTVAGIIIAVLGAPLWAVAVVSFVTTFAILTLTA